MKSTHSQRLERWLGPQVLESVSNAARGWYGPPIHLLDCPGSVRVCGDGDFIGPFEHGYFMSAVDGISDIVRRMGTVRHGTMNVGFASISDALARATSGNNWPPFQLNKIGVTGVIGSTNSLWQSTTTPAAGAAGAAAPGGTAHVKGDTGAFQYANPGSGTLHLTGADVTCSVISNTLLLYDRLFSVAKTMNSTGTEAVTGVPTRYQSTTSTNADYIGGNFGFIECQTVLPATAHNWTVCKYTNQAGTTGQTLPSVTGNSSNTVQRLDQPAQTWFTPLASGDTGIGAWSQMQCSATVATGAINFCIGHTIGFMTFNGINQLLPFDWLTNRNLAPRIFDNACLALLEPLKPVTTATTYTGQFYATSAA